jgi:hypothetical protein
MTDKTLSNRISEEEAESERKAIRKALIETEGPTRAEIAQADEQRASNRRDRPRQTRPPGGRQSPSAPGEPEQRSG